VRDWSGWRGVFRIRGVSKPRRLAIYEEEGVGSGEIRFVAPRGSVDQVGRKEGYMQEIEARV
jgi:hypothetical protein